MLRLPKEPSDPKLLLAAEEIKAILKKHDIAGICLIQSETHGEWINHITPSWSAAKLINDEKGSGIHVRCKRADYPSEEAHRKALADTCGMLCGFRDGAERTRKDMECVLEQLSKIIGIEHVTKFKPHDD